MLVLSRKKNQSVVFPNLGIEVVVQRIVGNTVSIGIAAPKSVQILRGELAEASTPTNDAASPTAPDRELLHTLRNQRNKAQLAVAVAQKRLQLGLNGNAEQVLRELVAHLEAIDRQVDEVMVESAIPGRDDCHASQGHLKRALVVEDDANERALLAGYLRMCGFTVSEAGDGVEALEFLDQHRVDLVILDMRMPRMNGVETLKAIRKSPSNRDLKVVVVSGEDRRDVSLDDEPAATQWFAKPLNPARLARCFETDSTRAGLAI